ncbi:hypothetical protein RRG08_037429, partial [Elysia crispata]
RTLSALSLPSAGELFCEGVMKGVSLFGSRETETKVDKQVNQNSKYPVRKTFDPWVNRTLLDRWSRRAGEVGIAANNSSGSEGTFLRYLETKTGVVSQERLELSLHISRSSGKTILLFSDHRIKKKWREEQENHWHIGVARCYVSGIYQSKPSIGRENITVRQDENWARGNWIHLSRPRPRISLQAAKPGLSRLGRELGERKLDSPLKTQT